MAVLGFQHTLKQLELNRQVLLRVLAKVVNHLHAFGRQLVHIVIERLIGHELAQRALAALRVGHDVVDAGSRGVEARNRRARIVIDCFIFDELAERAFAALRVRD